MVLGSLVKTKKSQVQLLLSRISEKLSAARQRLVDDHTACCETCPTGVSTKTNVLYNYVVVTYD